LKVLREKEPRPWLVEGEKRKFTLHSREKGAALAGPRQELTALTKVRAPGWTEGPLLKEKPTPPQHR